MKEILQDKFFLNMGCNCNNADTADNKKEEVSQLAFQKENRSFKDIIWEGNLLDFTYLNIDINKVIRIIKLEENKYSLRLTL